MDNIILIDKPIGWTSNDVVAKIKSACKYKKVGHAGTLDPNATGLLVIAINEGTKELSKLILDNKVYIAKIRFGVETETGDITGKSIRTQPTNITNTDIEKATDDFLKNEYWQKPHKYSAIKINGKKAYEYARKNIPVEIQPKLVKINNLEVINFNSNQQELIIKLDVSKGFYVRSFAIDLAQKLNTIACVVELRRISCGNFDVKNAFTLVKYLDTYGIKKN